MADYPTVERVARARQGGGFGDQGRHPYAWAVFVQVDGLSRRVVSACGHGHEWTSLDRRERRPRAQGFRCWWVSNQLDGLNAPIAEPD
jgi:hypothetical protein